MAFNLNSVLGSMISSDFSREMENMKKRYAYVPSVYERSTAGATVAGTENEKLMGNIREGVLANLSSAKSNMTTETQARYNIDNLISIAMHKPIEEVASNHDRYLSYFMGGKEADDKKFAEAFTDSFKSYWDSKYIANMQLQYDYTKDEREKKRLEKEMKDMEWKMATRTDFNPRRTEMGKLLVDTAPLVAQNVETGLWTYAMTAGLGVIANVGVSGAKMLSALNAFSNTYKGFRKAGGILAQATHGLIDTFIMEAGLASHEMMDMQDEDGNPITDDARRLMSTGIGIVNAIIEFVTPEAFGGTDYFNTAEEFARKHIKNNVGRILATAGISAVSESIEEGLQSAVRVSLEQVAKDLSNKYGNAGFDEMSFKQGALNALDAFGEDFFQSLPSMFIVGGASGTLHSMMYPAKLEDADSLFLRKSKTQVVNINRINRNKNGVSESFTEKINRNKEKYDQKMKEATEGKTGRAKRKAEEAVEAEYGYLNYLPPVKVRYDEKTKTYTPVNKFNEDLVKHAYNEDLSGVRIEIVTSEKRTNKNAVEVDEGNLDNIVSNIREGMEIKDDRIVVSSAEEAIEVMEELSDNIVSSTSEYDTGNIELTLKTADGEKKITIEVAENEDDFKTSTNASETEEVKTTQESSENAVASEETANADTREKAVLDNKRGMFNKKDTDAVVSRIGNKFTGGKIKPVKTLAKIVQALGASEGLTGVEFLDKYVEKFDSMSNIDKDRLAVKDDNGNVVTDDEGNIVYNSPKGATEITERGKAIIYAGQNADFSTFCHEIFHAITLINEDKRKGIVDAIKSEIASDKGKAQLEKFIARHADKINFRGDLSTLFTEGDGWGKNEIEFTAELFEAYLQDRTSLSGKIADFFKQIAETFNNIYNAMRQDGILNKRIVDAYDSLFGTPEDVEKLKADALRSGKTKFVDKNGKQVFFQSAGLKGAYQLGGDILHMYDLARGIEEKFGYNNTVNNMIISERIREVTGWEKGIDGNWRFEIPDHESMFDFGSISNKTGKTLKDIYDNPTLYKAYPFLADIKIKYEELGAGTFGSATDDEITINSDYLEDYIAEEDNNIIASTLVHEIQHMIQDYEGFAQGGNPFWAKYYIDESARRTNAEMYENIDKMNEYDKMREALIAYNDYANAPESLTKEKRKEIFERKFNVLSPKVIDEMFWEGATSADIESNFTVDEIMDYIRESISRYDKYREKAKESQSDNPNAIKYRELAKLDSYDLYTRLAGEIEARATEAKLNKDFSGKLTSKIEDTDRKDALILRMDDNFANPAIEYKGKEIPVPKKDEGTGTLYFQSEVGEVEVKEEDGTLLLTHSMKPEKLDLILAMGGEPMPSMAVTKDDRISELADGYGELVFIGNSDMVKDIIAEKGLYNTDIWSPVNPAPSIMFRKAEMESALKKSMGKVFSNFDVSNLDIERFLKYNLSEIESELARNPNGKENVYRKIAKNLPFVVELYLDEKGITPKYETNGYSVSDESFLDDNETFYEMNIDDEDDFFGWMNDTYGSAFSFYTYDKNNMKIPFSAENVLSKMGIGFDFDSVFDTKGIHTFGEMKRLEAEDNVNEGKYGYYEAKPRKIYQLEDYNAVAVPSNLNDRYLDILYDTGIDVIEYDTDKGETASSVIKDYAKQNELYFQSENDDPASILEQETDFDVDIQDFSEDLSVKGMMESAYNVSKDIDELENLNLYERAKLLATDLFGKVIRPFTHDENMSFKVNIDDLKTEKFFGVSPVKYAPPVEYMLEHNLPIDKNTLLSFATDENAVVAINAVEYLRNNPELKAVARKSTSYANFEKEIRKMYGEKGKHYSSEDKKMYRVMYEYANFGSPKIFKAKMFNQLTKDKNALLLAKRKLLKYQTVYRDVNGELRGRTVSYSNVKTKKENVLTVLRSININSTEQEAEAVRKKLEGMMDELLDRWVFVEEHNYLTQKILQGKQDVKQKDKEEYRQKRDNIQSDNNLMNQLWTLKYYMSMSKADESKLEGYTMSTSEKKAVKGEVDKILESREAISYIDLLDEDNSENVLASKVADTVRDRDNAIRELKGIKETVAILKEKREGIRKLHDAIRHNPEQDVWEIAKEYKLDRDSDIKQLIVDIENIKKRIESARRKQEVRDAFNTYDAITVERLKAHQREEELKEFHKSLDAVMKIRTDKIQSDLKERNHEYNGLLNRYITSMNKINDIKEEVANSATSKRLMKLISFDTGNVDVKFKAVSDWVKNLTGASNSKKWGSYTDVKKQFEDEYKTENTVNNAVFGVGGDENAEKENTKTLLVQYDMSLFDPLAMGLKPSEEFQKFVESKRSSFLYNAELASDRSQIPVDIYNHPMFAEPITYTTNEYFVEKKLDTSKNVRAVNVMGEAGTRDVTRTTLSIKSLLEDGVPYAEWNVAQKQKFNEIIKDIKREAIEDLSVRKADMNRRNLHDTLAITSDVEMNNDTYKEHYTRNEALDFYRMTNSLVEQGKASSIPQEQMNVIAVYLGLGEQLPQYQKAMEVLNNDSKTVTKADGTTYERAYTAEEKENAQKIVDTIDGLNVSETEASNAINIIKIKNYENLVGLREKGNVVQEGMRKVHDIFRLLYEHPQRLFQSIGDKAYSFFVEEAWEHRNEEMRHVNERLERISKKIEEEGGLTADRVNEKIEYIDVLGNVKEMTVNEAMGVYIYKNTELGLIRLTNLAGNAIDESSIDGIISHLTKGERAIADEMMKDFEDERERLADMAYTVYNKIIDVREFYYPFVQAVEDKIQNTKAGNDHRAVAKPKDTMLKSVTDAVYKLDLNVLDTYKQAVYDHERAMAWSGWVKRAEFIMNPNGGNLREILGDRIGTSATKEIDEYIKAIANPTGDLNEFNRAFNKVLGNVAVAKIAGNLMTSVKQLASAITAWGSGEADFKDIVSGMIGYVRNRSGFANAIYGKDATMRNRSIETIFTDLNNDRKLYGYERKINKVNDKLMYPIKEIDKMTALAVWNAVYAKQIRNGATEAEAISKARQVVQTTQSTGEAMSLSTMQRNKNPFVRSMFMFTNDLFQLWNVLSRDIPASFRERDWVKMSKQATGLLMVWSMMALLKGGWLPEEDEEFSNNWGDYMKDFGAEAVQNIPIIGIPLADAMSGWNSSLISLPLETIQLAKNVIKAPERTWDENLEQFYDSMASVMDWTGYPTLFTKRVGESIFNFNFGYMFGHRWGEYFDRN